MLFRSKHWNLTEPGGKRDKVLLNKSEKEYIDIAGEFNRTIGAKVSILKIMRLENPKLYRRYYTHKTDLEKERPDITAEQMLFHGTHPDAVANINANNFNRSYCGTAYGTWYGKGVYFATNASISHKFAKPDSNGHTYMYYANVLTGEFCKGKSDMKDPPAKDFRNPYVLFDSTVNDMTNPTEFVVYRDTQMYPHYLITYKRI